MNGLWTLLLLIFISALPVFAVLVWMRVSRFPITEHPFKLSWFLLALLGGALSLLIAAILQALFPQTNETAMGEAAITALLFKIFIQVALTEELGRLGVLALLLGLVRRFRRDSRVCTPTFGALTGLIAGLGFAVIETAMYGVGDFSIALVRAVTAAPLHGACGTRIGMAVSHIKDAPGLALGRFLYAVGIHGMYNFMVISPGIPQVFPILIAFTALLSSIQLIRYSKTEQGT
jgi:RsiW-degrading membrane proteinase PrsW (M82 family)